MTTVADKLRIKPGTIVRVINPPAGLVDPLGPLPDGVRLTEAALEADAAVLFAPDGATMQWDLPGAARSAAGDRLLWVAYPKGGSGLRPSERYRA